MDILDMQWSPRGFLASSSIDNCVMIWHPKSSTLASNAVLSPIRILRGHQSFVRGVAFDATGKYLASSGIDNVILVWDADNNFKEVRRIRNPVKDSPDTSLFRRMDWAPDGLSLCISSALKSGKPVGNVIKRKTWEVAADLVGHTAATSCCRFSPHMFIPSTLSITSLESSKPIKMDKTNEIDRMDALPSDQTSQEPDRQLQDDQLVDLTQEGTESPHEKPSGLRKSLRLTGVPLPDALSDDTSDSDTTSTNESEESNDSNMKVGFKLKASALSCVVAVGDQVGVVSIWGSHSNRALLVLRDIFDGPVTDISWLNTYQTISDGQHMGRQQGKMNLNGKTIFACCGLDGYVLIVDLEQNVLGEMISKNSDSFNQHIQLLYGKSYDDIVHKTIQAPIVQESASDPVHSLNKLVSAVSLAKSSNQTQSSNSLSTSQSPMKDTAPTTANVMALQVQTKTKDGKKRIQPVLLQDDGNIDESYLSRDELGISSLSNDLMASSSYGKASTVGAKRPNPMAETLSIDKRPRTGGNSNQFNSSESYIRIVVHTDRYICDVPRLFPSKTSTNANDDIESLLISKYLLINNSMKLVNGENIVNSSEEYLYQQHREDIFRLVVSSHRDSNPSKISYSIDTILQNGSQWSKSISSEVTCIMCVYLSPNISTIESPQCHGFLIVGAIDGKFDILQYETGLSIISSQLLLGTSICQISAIIPESNPSSESSWSQGRETVFRLSAMTGEGMVWLWDVLYDPITSKGMLKCIEKCSIGDIVKSLNTPDESIGRNGKTAGKSLNESKRSETAILIESFALMKDGNVSIQIKHMKSKDIHRYIYSIDSKAWCCHD